MMRYRFKINGVLTHPIYKEDFKISAQKDGDSVFMRKKLDDLVFVGKDYEYILGQPFDSTMVVVLEQSEDGVTWNTFAEGEFTKVDCKFDADNKSCKASIKEHDQYNEVLDGMEDEQDIITLAPVLESIKMYKRPLWQIYVANSKTLSNYIGGTYFETECSETTYHDAYEYMHFRECCRFADWSIPDGKCQGRYYFAFAFESEKTTQDTNNVDVQFIYDDNNGLRIYYKMEYAYKVYVDYIVNSTTAKVTLEGQSDEYPSMEIYGKYQFIMARALFAKNMVGEEECQEIGADDIYQGGNGYKYALPIGEVIWQLGLIEGVCSYSDSATQYGHATPTEYFMAPSNERNYYPINKSGWGAVSVWLKLNNISFVYERDGRTEYSLKDAYTMASVLDVLVSKATNGEIRHEANSEYSEFLYGGANPITGEVFELMLTPKSNLLHGDYDQPAQKAKTTLQAMLNALRDMFRLNWFVEDGKLRLEHDVWFRNGGSYNEDVRQIGVDLTKIKNPRNGKEWSFGQNAWEYEKETMPSTYEFGWMDSVTDMFEGTSIKCKSSALSKRSKEDITISSMTSDIDYMLCQPDKIGNDGFAIMACKRNADGLYIPFGNLTLGVHTSSVQNYIMSWVYLQDKFYTHCLPCSKVEVNGIETTRGTSQKKLQKVKFPHTDGFDEQKLIKVSIGNGTIENYSLSLSSKEINCELRYETEL